MVFLASGRSTEQELMDQPDISFSEMERCLRELERINRISLAYKPTIRWLNEIVIAKSRQVREPVRILDVACGGGDMLRRISGWASKQGLAVDLMGVDLNPHAITIARQRTKEGQSISYITGDVFDTNLNGDFNLIVNSLFTHHLPGWDIVRLMRWMEDNARWGWFINDLHRHWLPYHVVKVVAAMLPVGPMVRNDAPLSVARSFTAEDWRNLLQEADIADDRSTIRWYFPFRYGVSCQKP